MGGPEKGRLGLDGISLPDEWTAGLPLLKFSPESAYRAGVNALVDSYHAGTANFHSSAVLALHLQMAIIPVADDALSHLFFHRFSAPAG